MVAKTILGVCRLLYASNILKLLCGPGAIPYSMEMFRNEPVHTVDWKARRCFQNLLEYVPKSTKIVNMTKKKCCFSKKLLSGYDIKARLCPDVTFKSIIFSITTHLPNKSSELSNIHDWLQYVYMAIIAAVVVAIGLVMKYFTEKFKLWKAKNKYERRKVEQLIELESNLSQLSHSNHPVDSQLNDFSNIIVPVEIHRPNENETIPKEIISPHASTIDVRNLLISSSESSHSSELITVPSESHSNSNTLLYPEKIWQSARIIKPSAIFAEMKKRGIKFNSKISVCNRYQAAKYLTTLCENEDFNLELFCDQNRKD